MRRSCGSRLWLPRSPGASLCHKKGVHRPKELRVQRSPPLVEALQSNCRAIEGRRCRCTTLASMGVTSTVTWHEVARSGGLGLPLGSQERWSSRPTPCGLSMRPRLRRFFYLLLYIFSFPTQGLLRSSGCCAMQERQLGAWQLEKLSPLGTWQEPVPWRSGWSRNTSEQRLGFADSSA